MKKKSLKLINGETIEYQLEHRARRTVGLKITDDGLIVHAPKRIFDYQLQSILQEKSNWIIKKLAARKQNYQPPMAWQDGETLQLLGLPITLYVVHNNKNKQPQFDHDSLTITSPDVHNTEVVQRKVIQWYKKQALVDFGRRLEILSTRLGAPTPTLKLSNARSRWGSCSSVGDIRLNWRLLQAPPHIINYVICHELAHLKEMNHSSKFWAVVNSIFPEYKAAEKDLKHISNQLHRM